MCRSAPPDPTRALLCKSNRRLNNNFLAWKCSAATTLCPPSRLLLHRQSLSFRLWCFKAQALWKSSLTASWSSASFSKAASQRCLRS
ncbi:hypothetical protein WJX74_005570 [Apatococcus lobatus]|uniref:Uncharacterized protein n=1 Tax=Apatococcus lobatus TaxID=904363 RepID=A0AAW1S299_9CHLO